MPFVEIGKEYLWVRVIKTQSFISICKTLRDKFKTPKIRLYFDKENNLMGIAESAYLGYTISSMGRIRCRKLPESLQDGTYESYWDGAKNMVIVDLNKPIIEKDL